MKASGKDFKFYAVVDLTVRVQDGLSRRLRSGIIDSLMLLRLLSGIADEMYCNTLIHHDLRTYPNEYRCYRR
jgi:hypothetical protein